MTSDWTYHPPGDMPSRHCARCGHKDPPGETAAWYENEEGEAYCEPCHDFLSAAREVE